MLGAGIATMELTISALVGFVLFLLYLKFSVKRRRSAALIDKIPGPNKYLLIGTLLDLIMAPRHRLLDVVSKHVKLYSPIYRMWTGPLGEVHLTTPEYYETILSGMQHIEKGWLYRFLHPWLGFGLLTSKGAKWHSRRKIITPTFHFQILETFSDVFVENSQILVEKLEKEMEIRGEKGFDICPFVTRCALDIICETAMGVKVHAQKNTESEYMQAIHDISDLTMKRSMRLWYFVNFFFYLSKMGRRYKQCLNTLHGFTKKVIQERKIANSSKLANGNIETATAEDQIFGIKKRSAFLDLLLEASGEGKILSDQDIQEEVDTFMFEGHDTTTAGISWALFLLGGHPDIQERVFEELESIFQGSDRPITTRDCQKMKYLERVIKETLRLYPSVPFIMRKLEGDIQCGEYTLPDGVMIVIHIYHAHYDPKYFPNPEKFDPDNFLPERVEGRHPYAYVPFSAGPRNCIGQKFAMLEQKMVLASVVRRFKLRSLDRREDMGVTMDLILRPKDGVKVVLTKR